ncbi:LLM class F420-dependent oxidoreductase [Actinomadura sp. DC4]|uniref:LLM class F420-dependent oxidoreductase n=1 Tax=Actinomadura sp. DC4 TaxID=3055069 RepID=UPI0025B27278|nr:LLM class F420-dependent oxidoreductase [Actinomadura sp. DC4]MDN3354324.1 LLM class F420-dependent oxidoreductase [Actinomadura sp. DC4]
MEFGVGTFVTDESIAPAALGSALEERGFESLFVSEHSHIPVSRASRWRGTDELPHKYFRTLDPFVILTAAATVTVRLKVATGILLIVERDPITTAKEISSLDVVSGGRVIVGVAAGWDKEEMRDHGTDPATRGELMRERILAMKELWTKEQAEYHGRFVNFGPTYFWPKPVQRPCPPIVMGGGGPKTLDRVLEYGDGWMPNYDLGVEEIGRRAADLRHRAKEAGRGPVSVSVHETPADHDVIARLADAGVDRVLLDLPTLPAEETYRALDGLAAVARSFA